MPLDEQSNPVQYVVLSLRNEYMYKVKETIFKTEFLIDIWPFDPPMGPNLTLGLFYLYSAVLIIPYSIWYTTWPCFMKMNCTDIKPFDHTPRGGAQNKLALARPSHVSNTPHTHILLDSFQRLRKIYHNRQTDRQTDGRRRSQYTRFFKMWG